MRVTVKLFAGLRDVAGWSEQPCEVPASATARDVWDRIVAMHPACAPYATALSVAVNADYARFDTRVDEGDEVAFLPPVSGG